MQNISRRNAFAGSVALAASVAMPARSEPTPMELPVTRVNRLAKELCFAMDDWMADISQPDYPPALWEASIWPASSGRGIYFRNHDVGHDPLLDAVEAYRAAIGDYNENAPDDNDEADAYAAKSYAPCMEVIEDWAEPARTLTGAREAIRLVLHECEMLAPCDMFPPLLRAALAYLDGEALS